MEKILMVGVNAVHPPEFLYETAPRPGHCLLIMTNTPARFRVRGEWQVLPPHQAALFDEHSEVCYGAAEGQGEYGNDWMVFTSDETYVRQFPRIGEPFPVSDPDYLHSLLQLLTWEHRRNNYETVISQLMYVLFHQLELEIRNPDQAPYHHELTALRRRVVSLPQEDWTVARMAELVHLSPGYLQTLYKAQFGVSCMEDVIASRIRLAEDYLNHTRMSLAEIANLCGYRSPEHFSRQFHRVNGKTPGAYRQEKQK